MQPLAPIVVFIYSRPQLTEQTLEALAANLLADESSLYIYADGPKENASQETIRRINETRAVARKKKWCKEVTIIESEKNLGLANSVIRGVTEIINKYGSIIVLEDDMITSPYFITYMNEALSKYSNTDEVISIHGYCPPINYKKAETFFIKGADCWGWATWKRGWDMMNYDSIDLKNKIEVSGKKYEFDFWGTYPYFQMLEDCIEKKVDSWAILWYASAFLNNKLTLYPSSSLLKNTGTDDLATHKQDKYFMNTDILQQPVNIVSIPVEETTEAKVLMSKYFLKHLGLRKRIKRLLHIGY